MQTECTPALFEFEPVERKKVVAGFDGGTITSDAGALLLGRLDRGLGLIRRMAACFTDRRDPRLLEHTVETLVGKRVFGLALGYEDLNDHDHAGRCGAYHAVCCDRDQPEELGSRDQEPGERSDRLAHARSRECRCPPGFD